MAGRWSIPFVSVLLTVLLTASLPACTDDEPSLHEPVSAKSKPPGKDSKLSDDQAKAALSSTTPESEQSADDAFLTAQMEDDLDLSIAPWEPEGTQGAVVYEEDLNIEEEKDGSGDYWKAFDPDQGGRRGI